MSLGLAAVAMLFVGTPSLTVPAELQVTIFQKVLRYSKKLKDTRDRPFRVLVVTDKADQRPTEFVDAFRQLHWTVVEATPAEMEKKITSADAVYVPPGVSAELVQSACTRTGTLSLSGDAEDAERGLVAVALGVNDQGKPSIIINLKQLRAEGNEFDSGLLSLARIVH
jgi:hypothetical protein